MLVIASHTGSLQLSGDSDHALGVGPPRHEITNEDNSIVLGDPDLVQKLREFVGTAVYVSYPDRASHG
jgi:hypothetical protein